MLKIQHKILTRADFNINIKYFYNRTTIASHSRLLVRNQ